MRTIVAGGNQNASTATAIGKVSLAAKPVTLNQVQAASDKLNEALNASPSSSSKAGPSKPVNTSALSSTATPDEELPPGEVCEVCKSDEDEANILLCDDCDKGYHLSCLSPPLKQVPEDDWICDACLVGHGDDYGFEEGDEHTLASFHQRATSFRKKWLAKHPVPAPTHAGGLDNDDDEVGIYGVKQEGEWEKEAIVEDHVEREFWRLVESPTEAVEVEYGADIHTTKWGR